MHVISDVMLFNEDSHYKLRLNHSYSSEEL